MKKIFTFALAVLLMSTANAQTQKGDIDKDGKITVSDITALINIYLNQGAEEKADTTLFHEFTGYIFVTSAYFKDSYYGNDAKLAVYKTSAGEYIVTFSDPTWGDATFSNVTVGQELSGEGSLTMAYRGKVSTYPATIGGPMHTPVITMPDVMGGTTITFHPGTAPAAFTTAGNYDGTNTVVVGGQFSYTADVTYKITANADGTINIFVPEFTLEKTLMGDVTMGSYTISNVAWDEKKGSFYRDYSEDGLSFHMTAVNNGTTTIDSDYTFNKDNVVSIEAQPTEGGIKIINNFQPGAMPFPIVATFEGPKSPNLR
ncbi:MAG: hypothetical protein IJV06_00415 [Bacteroidaceae bacterium]|nr:hypothetical protein [Bacteroidaceae bacterium]